MSLGTSPRSSGGGMSRRKLEPVSGFSGCGDGMVVPYSVSQLGDGLGRHRSLIWVGAVSFEERCLGSLDELESWSLKLDRALVIDYESKVNQTEEDAGRRKK